MFGCGFLFVLLYNNFNKKVNFSLKMCLLIVSVCHLVLNEPCNIAERGGDSLVLVCRHGNQLYSVTF